MRKLALAFLFLSVLPLVCRAQENTCTVTTPYSMGGVTVSTCWGNAGTSATMSNETVANTVAAGYPFLLFGYFCEPGAGSSCTSSATGTSYILGCTSTSCSGGPFCTNVYSANLQNNANYMNVALYCPALGSSSAIYLVCSSTSATYTSASNCGFISGFLTLFSAGACTTSGAGCFDVGGNSSPTGATSMSTTLPSLHYTNEIVCALGGTINDEILSATNSGNVMFPGNSGGSAPGNTVACKAVASGGAATLGFSWTGSDTAGMLMVALKTSTSAAISSVHAYASVF